MSRRRSSIWPLSTSEPPRTIASRRPATAAGASRVRHSAGTLETMSAGHGERTANALSITQVIALGATVGDEVTVSATGDDASEAIEAVLGVLLAEGETG